MVKGGLGGTAARWFQAFGRSIFLAWIGLLLNGCAAIQQAEIEGARATVAERAQQRWDLLMKGQIESAYEYLSPASKSTISLDLFRKRSSGVGSWRSVKLEKVDCRPDVCQVTMLLEYDLRDLKGLQRHAEETWVRDLDNWWLVARR